MTRQKMREQALDDDAAELANLLDAVRRTATALEPKHFTWAVEAALKGIRASVAECENKIVRHGFFSEEPYVEAGSELGSEKYTRESVVQEARASLTQYRKIVAFLLALKKLCTHANAIAFGNEMASFFRNRRGA